MYQSIAARTIDCLFTLPLSGLRYLKAATVSKRIGLCLEIGVPFLVLIRSF